MIPEKLLEELHKGVVTIVYEKLDTGKLRTMPCTLNKDVAMMETTITKQQFKNEVILVFALDKRAWRDVRVNTIKEWYTGYPNNL